MTKAADNSYPGGVVETGSDGAGQFYTKYSDGTLVNYGYKYLGGFASGVSVFTWGFVAPFVNTNIGISGHVSERTTGVLGDAVYTTHELQPNDKNGGRVRFEHSYSSSISAYIHFVAWGRWK